MSAGVHREVVVAIADGTATASICAECGEVRGGFVAGGQWPCEPAQLAKFELGQRVAYSTFLRRHYNDHHKRLCGKPKKEWTTANYGDVLNPGGEGVIVGKRTLSNGDVVYPYEEGGGEYIRKESFTAYLVAYALHRSPVYVMPEHITALPEPAQAPENTGSVQPVLQ